MRKLISAAILASLPLSCFLFPFACGFLQLSQVYLMLLPLVMLFGPLVATGIVAWIVRGGPWWRHLAVSGSLYAAVFAVSFARPAGAAAWTIGFAYNLRLTKDPVRIQKWAVEVLAQYENGKLETQPNGEYWAAGKERVDDGRIPQHIRNLWKDKPSIGIATLEGDRRLLGMTQTNPTSVTSPDRPSRPVHCLAFSWYLTGVLVGPPDFRTTWNPWYIRQIIPGVYAYCGMK